MTDQYDNVNRWLPRYSVRTLVILVTLACVYFGSWAITKQWGCRQLAELGGGAFSPIPFFVVTDERRMISGDPSDYSESVTRTYYAWWFGLKLPLGERSRTVMVQRATPNKRRP